MAKDRFSAALNFFLLAATALIFNGCAEDKPVPPVFNLYGYQRIAVVPFDDQTQDPVLARDVQEEITDQVVNLGAVPVVQAAQVTAFLQGMNADPASVLTDENLRQQLVRKFKCDLLLLGAATGYNEFLQDTAPEQNGNQYGFYTKRKVVVNASAKLIDPVSGNLLWAEKNQGWSRTSTWNPLPVPVEVRIASQLGVLGGLANLVRSRVLDPGDVEPASLDVEPSATLIYPKSHYFVKLRQNAIYQTISGIVCDFQGRNNWVPTANVNANP